MQDLVTTNLISELHYVVFILTFCAKKIQPEIVVEFFF